MISTWLRRKASPDPVLIRWILYNNFWGDTGIWIDEDKWND